jgi:hypothetical protein
MYWMTQSLKVSHVARLYLEVIPVINVDTELLCYRLRSHAVIGFVNWGIVQSEKPASVIEACVMEFSSIS